MAESSTNSDNGLFNIRSTPSNEHLVFAETLRDWRDPLLQGHERISTPVCPRCATCRCESLKDFPNTSSNSNHHHHKHDPSCPNFRHYHHHHNEQIKTSHKQTISTKRRAVSHDSVVTVVKTEKSPELSTLSPTIKQNNFVSKIPVKISTLTNENSSSLILPKRSYNQKTKIPRLISSTKVSSPTTTSNNRYETDSLNDDTYQTPLTMSDNENTSQNTNQLDDMDKQILMKKKRSCKHNTSSTTTDKRSRRYRHKEGRHSKSRSSSNDLSSSSSSPSSSLSVVPLRKKSRAYRVSSPTQVLSSLSDDSLSHPKQDRSLRPHSTFVSTINQSNNSSPPPSLYLIQLTNKSNSTNSFGLTKTITCVWKSTHAGEDKNSYPRYSIEQVQPIINQNKHTIPISSRNILLQCAQIDYWQNFESSSNSIITSSCLNSTGSAFHLLSSSLDKQENQIPLNSHGHIISITTTKRCQPSLLNKTKNTQWNIEEDGKQRRYSIIKSHSDDRLYKYQHLMRKYRAQYGTDSNTDSGSSSEQNNLSAPPLLHSENHTNVTNQIDQVSEPSPTNINPTQTDINAPDHSSTHSDNNNISPTIIPLEKTTHISSAPAIISIPKTLSYASTDEDVDEFNSHYSEDINQTNKNFLYLNNESNENDLDPKRSFMEYSQITIDSGVDIISEQRIYQPNLTIPIDEQSSEETTNQHDLLTLSDDSLGDIDCKLPTNNLLLVNQCTIDNNESTASIHTTEQESYFSARSELNTEKDLYAGYELENITDEDDDYLRKDHSNELIITSEVVSSPSSHVSSIPPQFEFKLPSFGEWINRAFNTFLSESDKNPVESISTSRSSSDVSIHASHSTMNTSSLSPVITVLENRNISKNDNINIQPIPSTLDHEEHDDEHSLNDMSSSSLNSEKVDFDTYIIDSNYEKINPSITNEQNEILFITKRSKSLLSSITSSIENDDQEVMNNEGTQNADDDDDNGKYIEVDNNNIPKQIISTNTDELVSLQNYDEFQYSSNSHDSLIQSDQHMDTATSSTDDLTKTNQILSSNFYSKDSALDLSDDNFNRPNMSDNDDEREKVISSITLQDKTNDTDSYIDDETLQNNDTMICINDDLYLTEDDKSIQQSISSGSSEHLIPKEKQTGMYYKAFGSSAAIHLAEQYRCEWLQEVSSGTKMKKSFETDDHSLRIVHQSQTIGDNEDEFYYSPQSLRSSYSCPNLISKSIDSHTYGRSYSLSTLDAYTHLNITHETLEQIWLSLLDVAFSEKDDYELDEYKLRHIIGLSNSYSNMNQSIIEKSRSHNDIFSTVEKNNQKSIIKSKSKSFDITSLIKQSLSTNNSANVGLLQGADISEPFADRLISTSVQSDLESIQSLEPEQILTEFLPPSTLPPVSSASSLSLTKEPLDYVFSYSYQADHEEYDLESIFEIEDKPLTISITFDKEDVLPMTQIEDTYSELAKFRPHSLSTIPSSRASQYASSSDTDDVFEHENRLRKEDSDNSEPEHMSDDHGVIGSEFSSPRSRPLSSIHSCPLSPEQSQHIKPLHFSDIDNNLWEQSINEPIFSGELPVEDDSEYFHNLTSIIAIQSSDITPRYVIDQIEPTLLFHENHQENVHLKNFIQATDQTVIHPHIYEDYITIEQEFDINLDPNDLPAQLAQLDCSSNETLVHQQEEIINIHIIDKTENNPISHIENLISIVDEIHQINHIKTSADKLLLQQSSNLETKYSSSLTKPIHCNTQRIDKVSDLEIIKQGKGFKIGYIDRQGTDQRVILTKRIEAGPDIMERDPHIRLPFKGRRFLNQIFSSVLFTNGYNTLQEDGKFEHTTEGIEVPIIGTDPKHFDESDMISIDIDGPSTMLNSICESIVITQGSVYSNNSLKPQSEKPLSQSISNQYREHLRTSHPTKKDKDEVIDSWHDHIITNGSSTPWRSPFKPTKITHPTVNTVQTHHDIKYSSIDLNKQEKATHEIALSPVPLITEKYYQTTGTSPITIRQTVDRSCQYSPPIQYDQGLQCYLETVTSYTQVSSHQIPGFLKTQDGIQTNDHSNSRIMSKHPTTLERSADSGILVDDNHRMKSIALQVDRQNSSSDSEDTSEVNTRPIIRQISPNHNEIFDKTTINNLNLNASTSDIEQEISQLCRERAHILDLLALNWNRSNIWVELTEAKLNYIIGETDALLRALSFDSASVDNETVKLKMQQYEEDMAELTRQHLAVYRERLEASKKQLDMKIDQLELKKSSIENHPTTRISTCEYTPRSINTKRSKSFLSTSAENLTTQTNQEIIASHPQLLDVSFLTSTPSKTSGFPPRFPDHRTNTNETIRTIYRPTPRYPLSNNHQYDYESRINNGNLSHMEGLSKSQQAILDETDKLVKDSQQLHTESASQFERARESLLSSETPIRLARANMAASRLESYSGMKTYLPNDVTLAELFKYEQSLAKETAKNNRQIYTTTKTTTKS